ncbi:MAG: hypothetical protein AB1489_09880 [Acidobacteriota bacterium]
MGEEFWDWMRQANGLLLEAYRRQAQECKLCWEAGELRFQALVASHWVVIKAIPLESAQYLRIFHIATQMIDDGSHYQVRLPEASGVLSATFRINFFVGLAASDCAVRLVLESPSAVAYTSDAGKDLNAADEVFDSKYIN